MPKKSPQKPPSRVKKAVWQDPERQSLEDIAWEWECSLSYVEGCVRNFIFKHIIKVFGGLRAPSAVHHAIFNKASWPFKGVAHQQFGSRPRVHVHLYTPSDFPGGYTWGPAEEIFIPREEVRRAKIRQSAPVVSQPDIPLEGHSMELLVAIDISTEVYLKGNFRQQHSHKVQLQKALEKRHADKNLSASAKERIVLMANQNKAGGPPSFNR